MCCNRISHLCNFKSELALAQIRFFIAKHSKRRVLKWIITFVQIKVRVSTCTQRISYCKTLKKTCFAMKYRICAISSQSSHLHKSDFPFQNTQDVFWYGMSHLCKLKSELALAQSGFSIVKRSKRRVLQRNIAFVQFQVIVHTCTNQIFHWKILKKTCFAMDYRICAN